MAQMLILLIFLCCSLSGTLASWPEPTDSKYGDSTLWLSPKLKVFYGCGDVLTNLQYSNSQVSNSFLFGNIQHFLWPRDESNRQTSVVSEKTELDMVRGAWQRTEEAIRKSRFVPWKFHSRRSIWEPSLDANSSYLVAVQIEQNTSQPDIPLLPASFFDGDESYSLTISDDGIAKIKTNSSLGTIRAFQTFEQLFYSHSSEHHVYIPNVPLAFYDKPKWKHRGLNLDISRNFISPHDIKRTLDAMATVRMSRLHIHAADSQSWPLEIPTLPELAAKGAYQNHLVWSPRQLAEVQFHGMQRGISVFIEIDLPGHTGSVANAFPDIVSAFNLTDWSTFAAEPATGQLKLNHPGTYVFLDTLFDDVLPRIAPYTTLFHIGGDEFNQNTYLLDETVKSNCSSVLQPLVQKLMAHAIGHIVRAGLQPIVWEEMLLDWNLTLPRSTGRRQHGTPEVIVQSWRNTESLLKILQKGHRAIWGGYTETYLDCGYGGFVNPWPSGASPPGVPYNTSGGQETKIKRPFLDYCGPMKNWRQLYTYNPLVDVPVDLEYLLEGGEVHLWAELTDGVDLDAKLWPRTAAAAEVLWSGVRDAGMIEAASKRLAEWRERVIDSYGVRSSVVQMTWCLMEGGCNL